MSSPADPPVRSRRDEGGRTRDLSWPRAPQPLEVPVTDNHAHLEIRDGDAWLGVEEAIARAAAVGVHRIVQIGCDLPSARWTVRAVAEHEALLGGVAIHPNESVRLHEAGALPDALAEIAELARTDTVRVVGETGLDHFRTPEPGWAVQEEAFREHIRLARELGKPLQVHDRDAHADVLRVLDDAGAPDVVVMHCFSGDAAFAEACLRRGFYLSFAGTVTFANAAGLREALRVVPTSRILVETDAPFLAPTPHRGRPNSSYLIPVTLRAMAATLGCDVTELAAQVEANTVAVYGPTGH